ncbi:MAG: dipeptidase [Pseudomonadota bacterium]
MQRIFDGHNDTLLRLWRSDDLNGETFFAGSDDGHIDLPRARSGGFCGGFFAVYVPGEMKRIDIPDRDTGEVIDLAYIGPVDALAARRATLEIASILFRMERARPDAIRICRSAADIEAAKSAGAIAAVFHIEGAEAIGPDLAELDVLHAAGLRSLGPVWSRPNIFGYGAPFRFPGSPDDGPGLTAAGFELVKACNALNILVDLSHLNEKGFWDVAKTTDSPLVATHSNIHAISPSARNLTDKQLDAIAESGGVVGLNYATAFLRDDGRNMSDTPLTFAIRHLECLVEKLGEDGVALGSDFDGALMPRDIGDAAGLPNLVQAMADAGFGDALIDKVCWGNWVSVLRRTIG